MTEKLRAALRELHIILSERQIEKFDLFRELLLEWNGRMNLTRIVGEREMEEKHFLDSLAIVKAVDMSKVNSLIDVGSGAGFPGIPLKIVYPKLRMTLVDASQKKVAFLNVAIERLGLTGDGESPEDIFTKEEDTGDGPVMDDVDPGLIYPRKRASKQDIESDKEDDSSAVSAGVPEVGQNRDSNHDDGAASHSQEENKTRPGGCARTSCSIATHSRAEEQAGTTSPSCDIDSIAIHSRAEEQAGTTSPSCDIDSIAIHARAKDPAGQISAKASRENIAIHARAEDLAHDPAHREAYDLCVSRAVGKMAELSEYCLPFVKTGGLFVAYKSADIEDEIREAEVAIGKLGGRISDTVKLTLPGTDIRRTLVVIQKTRRTPNRYPRQAGSAKRAPIKG